MNGLRLEMSRAYGQNNGRRRRNRTFRKIDKLAQIVRAHAQRYRNILEEQWKQTEWTRKQAEQVLRRMDKVLEQLPAARRRARQRILKEEPVKNHDKFLGLYEPEVRVIVAARREPKSNSAARSC
jgi:preprotein translocase subunit SecA